MSKLENCIRRAQEQLIRVLNYSGTSPQQKLSITRCIDILKSTETGEQLNVAKVIEIRQVVASLIQESQSPCVKQALSRANQHLIDAIKLLKGEE